MSRAISSGRLVVASYNVHGCVGSDGLRDVARVARVIESLDADVIALQEVDLFPINGGQTHEVELLSHLVGLEGIAGPTREGKNGHYGNVLLTRLPIVAVRKLDCHGSIARAACGADVDLEAAGATVRVIATHLGLSPSERREQVRRILEVVSKDERLTILLGDINEWLVYGRPLRWLHARFGYCKAVRTFPARFPVFALDRIWVHPVSALDRFEARDTRESRTASDHLPVRAEVSLG